MFDGKKYVQSENRITPIADYSVFNPTSLNTDQWIAAAKSAGATFAILTVTHETGFALYQSDVNPYCLKAVKWKNGKGDVLQEFINSCNKYGIKPGIYIGIRWNSFMGVYDFKVSGGNKFAEKRQTYYNRYCERMTEELVTRYGKFFIIWFDGGAHGPEQGGPDILPIISKYQPEAIFYHNLQRADIRWGGSETGTVPYPCWSTFSYPSWMQYRGDSIDFRPIKYGTPNGAYFMPAMADAPLRGYKGRHEWFWEPGDESHIYPVEKLVEMYYGSVGRNATLILGLTPDPNGLLPLQDSDTLAVFGKKMNELLGKAVATNKGHANELVINLSKKEKITQVLFSEDIQFGQRVREFEFQLYSKGKWVQMLKGTSIGHKYIAHVETPTAAKKFRLLIHSATDTAYIKQFSMFNTEKK